MKKEYIIPDIRLIEIDPDDIMLQFSLETVEYPTDPGYDPDEDVVG